MAYSGGVGLPSGPVSRGPARAPARPAVPSRPPSRPRPPAPPPQNVNRPASGGTRGHWVPVGDKWQLIHATGKNQWAPGGVPGSSAPPKPSGQTPLPNNPLAPLTQKQTQRIATSTVTKAYAPALEDLGTQQSTARSMYETQQADNRYFASWLATQGAAMESAVSGANDKLAGIVTGIRQAQDAQFANSPAALIAAANARPGNVVNNAQQSDFTTGVPQAAATASARLGAAATQQAGNAALGNLSIGNLAEANQARIQAVGSKQFDALNTAVKAIANERTKLLASRTGDIAKEIARLSGVELSKRQWLLQQGELEKKLQITGANTASEILARQATSAAATTNAGTAATRASENARHNAAMEKIATQKGNQAAARQREVDRHNKAMEGIAQQRADQAATGTGGRGPKSYKYGKTATGVPAGSPAQQNTTRGIVNRIQALLRDDINTWHKGDPNALKLAWHDLKSGRYNTQRGKQLYNPNWDDGYLNAASNLLTNYGALGLTPGDVAFLANQGLSNIPGYYKVGPTNTAGAGRRT